MEQLTQAISTFLPYIKLYAILYVVSGVVVLAFMIFVFYKVMKDFKNFYKHFK